MLDLLITGGIVVTMAEEDGTGVINCGAVGIKGNRIAVVGESDEVSRRCQAHRVIDARGKVVMPGMIDAHVHTDIGLFKGLAQDTADWMQGCIWPLTEEMSPEESKKGSLIHVIEAVKAGTTTMCDYDENMRLLVQNHIKVGTRACVAQDIFGLPKNASETPIGEIYPLDSSVENGMLEESLKLIHEYHMSHNGRITCMLGPQAPDRVSKELLEEVREISRRGGHNLHMHVACGDRETNQMMLRYGKRTIPFLDEMGLLNERMIGVHLSVATHEELKCYAESGAAMVLCSGSEAIIDGNIPPAFDFDKYSKRLALGSDQTPGGNVSNMFNEMKFTAILNKCKYENPVLFPSWKMLRMATIDGARAIGLGDEIGSLEEGKKADLILVDFTRPHLNPVIFEPIRNIVPNLVYAANGSEVETSIIDGEIVMENRRLTKVSEEQAIREANEAVRSMIRRSSRKILSHDTEMVKMMREGKI